MDFPITVKAFQFCCFDYIKKVLMANTTINMKLFNFYLMNCKPWYEHWSFKNSVGLKVGKIVGVNSFSNVHFRVIRGHNHKVDEFTLADLLIMNPFDQITIFNIFSNDTAKYEPICLHMKSDQVIHHWNLEDEYSDLYCFGKETYFKTLWSSLWYSKFESWFYWKWEMGCGVQD